jgi:hypothetical protein
MASLVCLHEITANERLDVTTQTPDPDATSHEQSGGESPHDHAEDAAPARPDLEAMSPRGLDELSDRNEPDSPDDQGPTFGTVSNPNAGV